MAFETGDIFVMYSDGLTEARASSGEMYGTDRLSEVVVAMHDHEPSEIIEMIEQSVKDFSGREFYEDDLTVVVLRIREPIQRRPFDRYELTLAPSVDSPSIARQFISDCVLNTQPLPEGFVIELQLAVQEVLTNILHHSMGAPTPFTIILRILQDRVAVQVLYQGQFFRPDRVATLPELNEFPECGFGLYLIEHSVDSVAYAKHLDGRNCVHLVKVF